MKKNIFLLLILTINFVQCSNRDYITKKISFHVLKNKEIGGIFVDVSPLYVSDSSKVIRTGDVQRKIDYVYKDYNCYVKIAAPAKLESDFNADKVTRTIKAHIDRKYENENVESCDCYEIRESST